MNHSKCSLRRAGVLLNAGLVRGRPPGWESLLNKSIRGQLGPAPPQDSDSKNQSPESGPPGLLLGPPQDPPQDLPQDLPLGQPLDQSLDPPLDQPLDPSLGPPLDPPLAQSLDPPQDPPLDQPLDLPLDQPWDQPRDLPLDLSTGSASEGCPQIGPRVRPWLSPWILPWISPWISPWIGPWILLWLSPWISPWILPWLSPWIRPWIRPRHSSPCAFLCGTLMQLFCRIGPQMCGTLRRLTKRKWTRAVRLGGDSPLHCVWTGAESEEGGWDPGGQCSSPPPPPRKKTTNHLKRKTNTLAMSSTKSCSRPCVRPTHTIRPWTRSQNPPPADDGHIKPRLIHL